MIEHVRQYVRQHTSQLVCACSEDVAWDAVWAGSLARVNTLNCLTHVGHREREFTVLVSGSGPRRRLSVWLSLNKESLALFSNTLFLPENG